MVTRSVIRANWPRASCEPCSRLAAPLVLAEIGWMAMGVVDTMFVGRVSAEAIGRGEPRHHDFSTRLGIFASGLLLGLDTLVSQAFGAGDLDDCHHSLVNGVWLALLLILAGDGARVGWRFRCWPTSESIRRCCATRGRIFAR